MKKLLVCMLLIFGMTAYGLEIGESSAEETILTYSLGETASPLTPTDLVNAFLDDDPGMEVSNISYVGVDNASGVFYNAGEVIGIESGIILSSGDVDNIVGPNTSGDKGTSNRVAGDESLSDKLGGITWDASVLEFDFVPINDRIKFMYVFGSEEYNEFVGEFNDGFAFFVNGTDYAALPNGAQVSINTINLDMNSSYFIDNTDGSAMTQMDGYTVVVSLEAPVNAGVVNHLKMVVADSSDNVYDSFVLLKTNSLTSKYTDLSLTMVTDDSTPIVGMPAEVSTRVSNDGPGDTDDVKVRLTLPENVTFEGMQGDGTYDAQTGIWTIGALAEGQSAQMDLFVKNMTESEKVYAAEIISASLIDIDSVPDNNIETEDDIASLLVTPYIPQSDISISFDTSSTQPEKNSNVTISITAANAGPCAAEEVIVLFDTPEGIPCQSASGYGTFDCSTGLWRIDTIPVGGSVEIVVEVTANEWGTVIGEVVASRWEDPDSTPANYITSEDDYASVQLHTVEPTADLSIEIAPLSQEIWQGNVFDVIVSITNEGDYPADSVQVQISVPDSITVIGASDSDNFGIADGIWNLDRISPNETFHITLQAEALEENDTEIYAEVVSSSLPDPDSTPDNASETEDDDDRKGTSIVKKTPFADLCLQKTVDNDTPFVGSYITYTISLTNNGPCDAEDVLVNESMPAGVEFCGFSGPGHYDPHTSVWDIGDVANGSCMIGHFSAKVTGEGLITNIAEVTGSSILDNDSLPNNSIISEDDTDYAQINTRDTRINILVYYNPIEMYMSSHAVELWDCIQNKLDDSDISIEQLNELSACLENASCAKTSIYKVGQLTQALDILESLAEEVGCLEEHSG